MDSSMNNVEPVYELVDSLVVGSVSLPGGKNYHVNYCIVTRTWSSQYQDSEEELHVGPWPYAVAMFVKDYWLPLIGSCGGGRMVYTRSRTLSIKPRKGSIRGIGPTKGELEALILLQVAEHLDTYRRLQEWYSNSNR